MKHKIEIAPNLAIYIDGERVIGSKPYGLFLTTTMIVSDDDLKRLADRCFEVISDRKTENSSEKPNNCEHITEDGVTCAKYPACDDCLDNPLNKVKGSERLVKGSEQTDLVEDSPSLVKDLVKAFGEDGTWLERQGVYTLTLAEAKQRAVDIIESVLAKDEPTISKMEQVDKDINVRSKDEPQTADCPFDDDAIPCEWVCTEYGKCKYKPKDESQPQTCSFSDCDNFKNPDYERCIECKRKQIKLKTEQTERSE